MKLFEDTVEKRKSPDLVIAELFREFKEIDRSCWMTLSYR